jgi:hypothetical protein
MAARRRDIARCRMVNSMSIYELANLGTARELTDSPTRTCREHLWAQRAVRSSDLVHRGFSWRTLILEQQPQELRAALEVAARWLAVVATERPCGGRANRRTGGSDPGHERGGRAARTGSSIRPTFLFSARLTPGVSGRKKFSSRARGEVGWPPTRTCHFQRRAQGAATVTRGWGCK